MDGTCTGEHGVGQGKITYLEEELGAAVDIMKTIKQAIDPQNIMNPGRFSPARQIATWFAPCGHGANRQLLIPCLRERPGPG